MRVAWSKESGGQGACFPGRSLVSGCLVLITSELEGMGPVEKMEQSIQLKTEIAAPAACHGEDDEDDDGHGIDGEAA